ncbi:MAG: hypothetical protein ABIS50_03125 [Luteolibacter sp.]|uniref:hypothetical protein n=1 Tax=Luteolibacter sp. TaxID=1962973 RepID=UPI003267EDFF
MNPPGNFIRSVLYQSIVLMGALHAAEPVRPLMRDFIGLNGHTVQFKPELYQPVCRLVRDYHPVAWDLEKQTATLPPFPSAKNKVDWNQVYGSWKSKGWITDACLMFESVDHADWTDLDKDARSYGAAFSKEFGPSGKSRVVSSVEIGNEPGSWSDADYSRMFRAMATGIRAGDPKMTIASCNLTSGASGKYEKSVSCIADMPELVDVLTIHSYAELTGWPSWKRSFPEDPALPKYLKDIENLCVWRDQHMPGKPVWITEFGYDSTTQPNEKTGDFAKWEGVTDEQQAQWIVRSLLVFSSMPVERAYLYFFNDEDKASVHASAGLTRHFKPKPSFYAVRHLQQTLGDFRFRRIPTNDPGKLRIQEYESEGKTIWAVWSPTGDSRTSKMALDHIPGKLESSSRMPLTDAPAVSGEARQTASGSVELEVGGSPVYLTFEK